MIKIFLFVYSFILVKLLALCIKHILNNLPEAKVKLTKEEYDELKGALHFAESYNTYYDLCLKDILSKKKITKADIKRIKKGEYLCFDLKEIHLSKSGKKMYVNDGDGKIYSYVLNKNWDISTADIFQIFERNKNG